ncbi:hypothetical protein GCM10010193_57600 [Kitasatospora atroaurantiaca]|uniref:Uncharacterized protein n=1 Tax=Kitasatospora atroaurantiaca TaxID=285545 RepID=A0A561EN11_9ACTN|nr:hypothetical protein [Kitasatospora atroaurantiaca]TWE17005.1 hypothetical protein FB465_2002 [Kitasatospora atroaurantiaca]
MSEQPNWLRMTPEDFGYEPEVAARQESFLVASDVDRFGTMPLPEVAPEAA